jgi:hypothetical protein
MYSKDLLLKGEQMGYKSHRETRKQSVSGKSNLKAMVSPHTLLGTRPVGVTEGHKRIFQRGNKQKKAYKLEKNKRNEDNLFVSLSV